MPIFNLKDSVCRQAGLAPIILIIILTVVIAGVAGATYQSRKEIKVRSDQTSETTELKGSPAPSPKNADIAADQTGRLSEKSVELKADNSTEDSPKFSITPPAGWEKLAPDGNIVVEFLSPSKDTITEGLAFLNVQPNITVFVAKENFKDLDEARATLEGKGVDSTYQDNSKKKTSINGEEAYIIESTIDLSSSVRQEMEAQLKQAAQKSGGTISDQTLQKDMDKVLQQAKGKVVSYAFYKNGYYINVAGKALESFWGKRGPQLKQSMDTFKFE